MKQNRLFLYVRNIGAYLQRLCLTFIHRLLNSVTLFKGQHGEEEISCGGWGETNRMGHTVPSVPKCKAYPHSSKEVCVVKQKEPLSTSHTFPVPLFFSVMPLPYDYYHEERSPKLYVITIVFEICTFQYLNKIDKYVSQYIIK